MHSLSDLKRYFEKHHVKITHFNGIWITTKKLGKWGLAFDEFRQDHVIRTRKEIEALVNPK